MPDISSAPQGTILIKKEDGTEVRMTLDEFRAYKRGASTSSVEPVPLKKEPPAQRVPEEPSSPSVVAPAQEPVTDAPPVQQEPEPPQEMEAPVAALTPATEQHLATATPVTDYFVDVAESKTSTPQTWDAEDHTSLLVEELPESAEMHAKTQQPDDVQQVLDQLPFSIPQDLYARVQSLVTSRRKGVRTDEQLLEYAKRDVNSGGLGLVEDRARLLVATVNAAYRLEPSTAPEPKPSRVAKRVLAKRKKKMATAPTVSAMSAIPQAPDTQAATPTVESVPPVPTPAVPPQEKPSRPTLHDVVAPPAPAPTEALFPSARPETAAPARDMHAFSPTVGPIQEIQTMTVEQFAALATATQDPMMVVEQKFANLAKESPLLFIEGREAWYHSPLYQSYAAVLEQSLTQGTPVDIVLGAHEIMTQETFDAVVALTAKLEQ